MLICPCWHARRASIWCADQDTPRHTRTHHYWGYLNSFQKFSMLFLRKSWCVSPVLSPLRCVHWQGVAILDECLMMQKPKLRLLGVKLTAKREVSEAPVWWQQPCWRKVRERERDEDGISLPFLWHQNTFFPMFERNWWNLIWVYSRMWGARIYIQNSKKTLRSWALPSLDAHLMGLSENMASPNFDGLYLSWYSDDIPLYSPQIPLHFPCIPSHAHYIPLHPH